MRRSLLHPIPELELAAKLLDAAVDAIELQKLDLARELLMGADLKEVMAHAVRLVGQLSVEIHRVVKRPACLPVSERDPTRMPAASAQREIFKRDGWRCRFCAIKVIDRAARAQLVKIFPAETRWNGAEFQRHAALYAMAASLDHVVPHGRGGKNEVANFVTACYCCQFGRGEWTLEEMELEDPRSTEPVIGSWDGLTRLLRTVSFQP